MRRRVLLLLGSLLALGAPSFAQDDVACAPPDLVLPAGPRVLAPGGEEVLDVFLQNVNDASVVVRLNATAPSGWRAALDGTSVPLGPRTPERANATVRKLALAAPQRGGGVASGDVVVTAVADCAGLAGAPSPPASAAVAVRLADPPPALFYLGGGSVLAGAVFVVLWRVARQRAGVRIVVPDPVRELGAARDASFPLRLENQRSRPETVAFRTEGLPRGWTAYVPLAEVTLEPGESKDLWLLVRAPPWAAPGDEARFHLRVLPRQAAPVPAVPLVARMPPRA